MDKEEDVIDFMPSKISQVVERDGYIAVVMPCQPCYSQRTGGGADLIPLYSCEMRVYGGKINLLDVNLPFTGEFSGVKYSRGERGCFLPFDFSADGPVELSFSEDDTSKPVIIIRGDRFSLEVFEKVEDDKAIYPSS